MQTFNLSPTSCIYLNIQHYRSCFQKLSKTLILSELLNRDVFRTLSKIYDEAFLRKYLTQLIAVNNF